MPVKKQNDLHKYKYESSQGNISPKGPQFVAPAQSQNALSAAGEFLPLLAGGILASFAVHPLFALLIAAAFFYHLTYKEYEKKHPKSPRAVLPKQPDGQRHTFFTSMLYRPYKVVMPSWLYTASAITMLLCSIVPLQWSLLFIPFTIWMFNWARTYFIIGSALRNRRPGIPVQEAPNYEQVSSASRQTKLPDLPKNGSSPQKAAAEVKKEKKDAEPSAAQRYYSFILKKLNGSVKQLDEMSTKIDELLDLLFGNSVITKQKYKDQIVYARNYAAQNVENARRAIKLFGSGELSDERREILEQYVKDSASVTEKVNQIVDDLIRLDQNEAMKPGKSLDESLNELAVTTKYYKRS